MVSPTPRALRLAAALITGLLLLAVGCGPTQRKIKVARLPVGDDHQVLWTHNMIGQVVPGPVLDRKGQVLASSTDGTLYALDPATGQTDWDFHGDGDFGGTLSTSPLVLADGTIAWPGPAHTLYGLAGDGTPLWRVQFRTQVLTPVAGNGKRIYVADRGAHLTALDLTSAGAKVAWTVALGSRVSAGSPAISSSGLVLGTSGSELVAVRDEGSSGRVAWKFATRGQISVSPAVAPGGTIVIGSDDGTEYGVTPQGRQRWRYPRAAASSSSPLAAANGKAYFGDDHGIVTTLDAATGRRLATAQATGAVLTRPALGPDGAIYVGTRAGWIQGFRASGSKLFAIKSGGPVVSYPVVNSAGVLFAGSTDALLYAIKPR